MDDLVPFLQAYSPLISALRELDPRKHTDIVTTFQMEMSAIFKREAADLIEMLRTNRLLKRGPDEKGYCILSLVGTL